MPERSNVDKKISQMEEEDRNTRVRNGSKGVLAVLWLASLIALPSFQAAFAGSPEEGLDCQLCTRACDDSKDCDIAFFPNLAEIAVMRAEIEMERANCTSEFDIEEELSNRIQDPRTPLSALCLFSSDPSLWFVVINFFGYSLFAAFPKLVTQFNLQSLDTILHAGMICARLSVRTSNCWNWSIEWHSVALRTISSIIHGTPRSCCIFEVIYLGVAMSDIDFVRGRSQSMVIFGEFREQLQNLTLILFTVFAFSSLRKTAFAALLEAQSSKYLETAAMAVMKSTCDAVARLSSSYELIEPCPKLAHLLLRAGTMESTNFAELLDEDSQLVFKSWAEGEHHDTVQSQHVSMRDVNGSRVSLQLFYVAGEMAAGERFFIVGVKEDLEANWNMEPRPPPKTQQEVPMALPLTFAPGSNLNLSEVPIMQDVSDSSRHSYTSDSRNSSAGSAQSMALDTLNDNPELLQDTGRMFAFLDLHHVDYLITRCSVEFHMFFGPLLAGACFKKFIREVHHLQFGKWFQNSVNELSWSNEASKDLALPLKVRRQGATFDINVVLKLHPGQASNSGALQAVVMSVKEVACESYTSKRKGKGKRIRKGRQTQTPKGNAIHPGQNQVLYALDGKLEL